VTDFESLSLSFGAASLEVSVERAELVVKVEFGDAEPGPWGLGSYEERWAAPGAAVSIELAPALPDRVVVVHASNPFRIAPGTDLMLHVALPLWAQVRLPDDDHTLLAEIPSQELSPTWWGDKTRGEEGYWLDARVEHSDPEPSKLDNTVAMCPLRVVNRSHRVLDVDQLAVWAPHLSLYETPDGLWADETHVVYTGDSETRLDVSEEPPRLHPEAALIKPRRKALPKGLKAVTFAHLKSLEMY